MDIPPNTSWEMNDDQFAEAYREAVQYANELGKKGKARQYFINRHLRSADLNTLWQPLFKAYNITEWGPSVHAETGKSAKTRKENVEEREREHD